MPAVRASSVLSFTVTGGVHEFVISSYSAADLRRDVIANLSQRVDVLGLDIRTDEGMLSQSWNYCANVDVRTRVDHGSETDVAAIVGGAFWNAADSQPIVTLGRNSHPCPIQPTGGLGLGVALGAGAILVLGAIVLVIWARP